jgi:3-hydroxybutyrate dehydrogenase
MGIADMNMTLATPATSVPLGRPLEGRTALVTGSTSGIGLGIARAFAAAGADVVLNGLGDAAAIEAVSNEIADAHGVSVTFDGANLFEHAEVSGLIERTIERAGALDILVNNAGIQHVAPLEEFPIAKWDAILALNLTAAFLATRSAFPAMKARGHGRIVNVASAHALVASPFKAAYVAAKHGIVGLTKVIALEGAEHGVTANAICPGYVWTPLVEKQIEEQAAAHGIARERVISEVLLKQQAVKRFATVEELGALAVFLASDLGASTTGAAIAVDGGWTAH